MDKYVTGSTIRRLRKQKNLTQEQLAQELFVSSKTISKWVTDRGFPDVSLIESLSQALGVSIIELFSGESVQNRNKSANILRSKIYVCPVCGNVIVSLGETVVSCCGIALPYLEAEECDLEHNINIEKVEDEYYVTMDHPATKTHYISFFASVSDEGIHLIKLYPEGNAEARFKINRIKWIYAYCNHHGLYKVKL